MNIDLNFINLGVLALIYAKLLSIEKRMGRGDAYFEILIKHCKLFNQGGRTDGNTETDCSGQA